jgi:hypothetical protein
MEKMPMSNLEPVLLTIADALLKISDDLSGIRECVCKDGKPPKADGVVLDVPWLSQLGPLASFAPGDCGPACCAMWLNFYGRAVTVDDVSAKTGLPRAYKWTLFVHLIKAMRFWGYETYWDRGLSVFDLVSEIDRGHPCIVLVDYDHLPTYYDANYAARSPNGHWVLFTGYKEDDAIDGIAIHDPYYPDRRGEFVTMTTEQFLKAWGHNHESGNSDFQAIRLR